MKAKPYLVKIILKNSKGVDKCIDSNRFNTYKECEEFTDKYNAVPLEYKTQKGVVYYEISA